MSTENLEHEDQNRTTEPIIDILGNEAPSDPEQEIISQEGELITLEVRKSNLPAIRCYQKHGYLLVGERKNFYENPQENALLMTKFLTAPKERRTI